MRTVTRDSASGSKADRCCESLNASVCVLETADLWQLEACLSRPHPQAKALAFLNGQWIWDQWGNRQVRTTFWYE